MPEPEKLRSLLKLLDDDALDVRRAVIKELSSFGPALKDAFDRLEPSPGPGEWRRIENLLDENHRVRLRDAWPRWWEIEGEKEKLEAGYSLLSQFLQPGPPERDLKKLLDDLAQEHRAAQSRPDVFSLAEFLFRSKGLRGADSAQYYDPLNSSLFHVIERRRGLPISLAAVYMLTGHRLGFVIEGCNFPGHFLARVRTQGRTLLVDCFHKGRFFEDKEILRTHAGPAKALRELIHGRMSAEIILGRALRNLISAYEKAEEPRNRRLMADLLGMLESQET